MTITLTDTDYTLAAGQALDLVHQSGVVYSGGAAHSVTIAGRMTITAAARDPISGGLVFNTEIRGVSAAPGLGNDLSAATVTIASSGVVSIDSALSDRAATGVVSGVPLINQGLISVKAAVNAVGASVGIVGTIPNTQDINAGTIQVVSTAGAATGVDYNGGAGFRNTGLIEVSGGLSTTGVHAHGLGAVENAGQIIVHDLPGATGAVAMLYEVTSASPFSNTGLLQGDVALKTVETFVATFFQMAVQNSGVILGEVDLAAGPHTLTNSGSITGAVNFGMGNDLYDGWLGHETGLISGGMGNDTELGGAGFDNFQGNQGDDSLSGGAGDDVVVGGKDDDTQFGDAGNDVVWGNLGNDTLDGGDGNDQVRGGQGDDSVSGGAGDDFVSGDRGADTISGGAGADIFHGSQDAGLDRVLDFHLAEGDRVQLDPGTTFTVSQVGADTVIDMGPSGGQANQMILVGVQMSTLTPGWIFGA